MAKTDDDDKFKKKWWVDRMNPANMTELGASDRRNAKIFNGWYFLCSISFVGIAVLKPVLAGIETTPIWVYFVVLAVFIVVIKFIFAGIRLYSKTTDELIRKIQYEAVAVGFLAALFLGMCSMLLELIVGKLTLMGPMMFFGLLVGYLTSLVLAYRKYYV